MQLIRPLALDNGLDLVKQILVFLFKITNTLILIVLGTQIRLTDHMTLIESVHGFGVFVLDGGHSMAMLLVVLVVVHSVQDFTWPLLIY